MKNYYEESTGMKKQSSPKFFWFKNFLHPKISKKISSIKNLRKIIIRIFGNFKLKKKKCNFSIISLSDNEFLEEKKTVNLAVCNRIHWKKCIRFKFVAV